MIESIYQNCKLCPRECGVDRTVSKGFCGQTDKIKIARADLHFWEEPCISGTDGSGTVFFSGCTLKCCFCQNFEISQEYKGYIVSEKELCEIFLMLQDKGAHNINLVSATQFLPSVIKAIELARPKLKIPIVYNCGGYESVNTVKALDGYVDIFLPDLKYHDDLLASKFSSCKDYFSTAISAIKQMHKQVGNPKFDDNGIMRSGVIVRHLVLPNHRDDSIKLLEELSYRFKKDEIIVSLMSQYIPMHKAFEFKDLSRRVSTFEYNKVLSHLNTLGFEGFSQERDSANKAYIPEFSDKK